MVRTLGWGLMTLSAMAVAAYASVMLLVPEIRPPFLVSLFSTFPNLTSIHLSGGSVAMVAGALQLNASIREKHLSFHRLLGRIYVGGVLFSGIAGLLLAINSVGGMSVQLGFALLAVSWLGVTACAYSVIRKGKVGAHKKWMIRSYALTLAGVTLRLYLGLSVVLGIKFPVAYPVLAWLCWIPNLILAEWYLRAAARRERVRNESSSEDALTGA